MSQTVAVFGATGAQGGSVVKALLNEPARWKVVGLTRDVNSEKAKALLKSGVELRSCDINKPDQIESALKGVDVVFGVTDFWGGAGRSEEREIQTGKNIIDAAKKAGVVHLVFSSLENTKKISDGKRHVAHFDTKSVIEEYLEASGVPFSVVEPSVYFENLKTMVRPNKEGQLEFAMPVFPSSKISFFSVDETGLVVSEIMQEREKYLNKRIAMVSDLISPEEIASTLSSQFGKQVKFTYVPEEVFGTFFPGADELAEMFGFIQDYGYFGEKIITRDIWEGKAIAPISDLSQWAKNWKL